MQESRLPATGPGPGDGLGRGRLPSALQDVGSLLASVPWVPVVSPRYSKMSPRCPPGVNAPAEMHWTPG